MATDAGGEQRTALLIDWGGVLTTDLLSSFRAFAERSGVDPQSVLGLFRRNPSARELLVALETGEIEEPEFERRFAEILQLPSEGLIDGLFSGVGPEPAMVDAVRRARAAGVRTALVSNSWGVHRYPTEMFDELFDGIVISGHERVRKPAPRMYELGAERAGVHAEMCVFVDDLTFNLPPAQALGMATVHHTSADLTIPQLEALLGVPLRDGAP